MMPKNLIFPLLLFLLSSFSSCYKVEETIKPQVKYMVQEEHLRKLPSPFPSLSLQEEGEAWGREYFIGQKFARELDLYRALTAFKRSEFLLSPDHPQRIEEVQYQILLSYYLGKRYHEVIKAFNRSLLYRVDSSFSPYHDLLIILYESYLAIGQSTQATRVLSTLSQYDLETAKTLQLSTALTDGDLKTLKEKEQESTSKTYLSHLLDNYGTQKKSISKAQALNALLPGAGYLYVGQKQSALTAFFLNGLFILAAIHFFQNDHIAAGIITTSFEAGWYFGGIYGAGEAAKLHNERLYEKNTYSSLSQHRLFPILMLKYGF